MACAHSKPLRCYSLLLNPTPSCHCIPSAPRPHSWGALPSTWLHETPHILARQVMASSDRGVVIDQMAVTPSFIRPNPSQKCELAVT